MKNTIKIGLVFILLLSLLVVACGKKETDQEDKTLNETVNQTETEDVTEADEVKENESKSDQELEEVVKESSEKDMDKMLKEAAQKEGVSVKELEKTLDKLAELGGEKYGISKEDYIKQTEESGTSVLEEWTLTSEVMGISITELYEAEKASMANRSDEDKQTLAGMAAALDEIGAIDLDQIEGEEAVNALLGMTENTSGEMRVVEGEFKDFFYYKADEIDHEYEDDYSIVVDYYTNEDIDKVLAYYIGLLENTKDYMLLAPYGMPGGIIQGYFNEMIIFVDVVDNEDGRTAVSCYLDYSSKD